MVDELLVGGVDERDHVDAGRADKAKTPERHDHDQIVG